MIALTAIVLIIGVFIAGSTFAMSTVAAFCLLGFCVTGLGLLIAAAETHGFEGHYVPLPTGVTWGSVSKQLFLMNENKARFFNDDHLYVQTPMGAVAVTGVFQARINHEMSIVLDTEPVEDASHVFTSLKQGVV